MAKQSHQKLKLLYLLRILFEQTDENSGLTLAQISAELAKYNVSAARKSLYDDIEALRLFGIEVGVKRDRYVRYYISKRNISVTEMKLVIDALNEFEAVSPSASYELSQKLMKSFGIKGCELIDEPFYKTPKVVFDELTKSLGVLGTAILQGKKIYCKQFVWNSFKQRTLLNDGKRLHLTPIRILCDKKYLLYAYDGKSILRYDVRDLIDVELSIEDAACVDEYRTLLDEQMYSLEYENLRLEFSSSFAGEVFGKFGLGVTVLSSREDSFEISVKVKLDDDFFAWVFNNAKHLRIVSPERVCDAYKQKLLLALDNTERDL